MEKLFTEMEMPLVSVLAGMEDAGIKLDTAVLKEMSKKMKRKLNSIEKKIHGIAGTNFNIKSTQQLREVLFEKLDDPAQAASLEILRYNEELGEIHEFKVAKNGKTGLWTIPSHSDYPADAEDRIRDVATSLVGLKVLGVVTED